MKVNINNVIKNDSEGLVVTFTTSIGSLKAKWNNCEIEPVIGKMFTVELDIIESANIDYNTCVIDPQAPSVKAIDETIVIEGKVEDVEDDGLAYLRLTDDALIMVDTDGRIHAGNYIRITLPYESLTITAIGE